MEAHARERGKERFLYYEKLLESKRYQLLKRLDQLEMVSVEHNRRSIERDLSAILEYRCTRSPMEILPAQPRCSCGFELGENISLRPINELEREIDKGITETMAALKAPAIQEKIIPYLEGLDLVEKGPEAEAVRRFLAISSADEDFLDRLDKALIPRVVFHINEAFHGKVLVVERNVDRLYQSLVHRKYTLSQTRKIIGAWLEQADVSEDTFLPFCGKGRGAPRRWNQRTVSGISGGLLCRSCFSLSTHGLRSNGPGHGRRPLGTSISRSLLKRSPDDFSNENDWRNDTDRMSRLLAGIGTGVERTGTGAFYIGDMSR